MNLILNNPYRVIGILVGTPLREQVRQISRLKQYADAEQEPPEAFSFLKMGLLKRTIDSVDIAASKLTLDRDRLSHSLFWFYNGNEIVDEPAFEMLKVGDVKSAVSVWAKITNDKAINKKNASAFFNLSTLLFANVIKNGNVKEDLLRKGLKLKLQFLESEHVSSIITLSTDASYQTNKAEIQNIFIDHLLSDLTAFNDFSIFNFAKTLAEFNFLAKKDVLNKLIAKPLEKLNQKLVSCSKSRNEDDSKALKYGYELFHDGSEMIEFLKEHMVLQNYQYETFIDKAGGEVLQCAIDYFLHFKDSSIDPGPEALELSLLISDWITSATLKQKYEETIDFLLEWNNGAIERNKVKIVQSEIDLITAELEKYGSFSETFQKAKNLMTICKVPLSKIKASLGGSDSLYLTISAAIVHNTQQTIINIVNNSTDSFSRNNSSTATLKTTLTTALDLSWNLKTFDMETDIRTRFNTNFAALKSLCTQFSLSTLSPREKVYQEIIQAEALLTSINNKTYFDAEIRRAKAELARIMEWQFLRSESDRDLQIKTQQRNVDQLISKAAVNKNDDLRKQRIKITEIKKKLDITLF